MTNPNVNCDLTEAISIFINHLYTKGCFQILMFLLIQESIMYTGVFIAFSETFTAGNMNYICNIPKHIPTLKSINNSCVIWNMTTNKTAKCNYGYIFFPDHDFVKSSVKADFQLICDRRYFDGLSQSFVMGGFFIGGIIGPVIADKYGRRFVLFFGLFLAGIIGIILGFVNNIYIFIAGNFLFGILREVTMTVGFVFGLEFIPNNKQALCGMITQIFWSINLTSLGIMAYLIRDWRYLQILGSSFIFITGLLVFIIPESPRWLITKGKFQQLEEMLEKYANKINRNKFELHELDMFVNLDPHSEEITFQEQKIFTYTPVDIFRSKILFNWTMILIFGWIFIILSYYGTTMLSVKFPGNKYLTFILSTMLEVPSILCTFLILGKGRNITMLCLCLICGTCYISIGFINKDSTILLMVVSILGKGSLAAIFYVIVVTSIYIYPTTIRTFGTGLPSAIGKLFAVIVPQFVKLSNIYIWLPTLIIGISACVIGFVNIRFPDWINRPLPESLDDLELLKKSIGLRFKTINYNEKISPIMVKLSEKD